MNEVFPNIIRILLVHSHALAREALGCLIEADQDMRVIGENGGGDETLELAAATEPDVAILDFALGEENTLALVTSITTLAASPKLLVLSALPHDAEPNRLAIRLGASGVVHMQESGQVLRKAIRRIHAGELWIDRSMTAAVLQDFRNGEGNPPNAASPALSQREREIVYLVAQGLGTQKLADRLHISEKTVRNHLSSIYEKLKVSNRLELAIHAAKLGLTQPPLGVAAPR